MHDHVNESRGHVLFRVTRGNSSGTCIETICVEPYKHSLLVHCIGSSQHGLKQIKLCFKIHVPVVRQHCAQMEGYAFSHIKHIDTMTTLYYRSYTRSCDTLGGVISTDTTIRCHSEAVLAHSILVKPGATLTLLLAHVTTKNNTGILVQGSEPDLFIM